MSSERLQSFHAVVPPVVKLSGLAVAVGVAGAVGAAAAAVGVEAAAVVGNKQLDKSKIMKIIGKAHYNISYETLPGELCIGKPG